MNIRTRFGIAGTGRISDWVLKGAVLDPRFKAVAVCSRSEERARAFIAKHPEAFDADAQIFTSIEEMAVCPEVDAIYIGTPNHTHLRYALAGLKAGKHVLCEKPMGRSEEEVRTMVEAARERGVVLMEAMISTLNPLFRAARERIPEIGPIRHYSSSFCQYSTKYDALLQGIVANSFDPRSGGGALQDIGVYTTFPLISLFGYPSAVHASLVRIPTPAGLVNIQGSVLLTYPGMTASLAWSKAVDSFAPTEICGERGNIVLDAVHIVRRADFVPHGVPTSGRGVVAACAVGGVAGSLPGVAGHRAADYLPSRFVNIATGLPLDEYFYEFEEFINVIQNGDLESSVNSLEVSVLNARLIDCILSS